MSVRACSPKKKVRAYEGAAVGLFNVIRAGTAGAGSEEVRVRRPRRDGVYGDPARAEVLREDAHHLLDGALRRGV